MKPRQQFFTLQHRAGVSPYTSFYKLAETCVFSKQSLPPILCQLFEVALKKLPLLPKLRGYFAEFLQQSYLKRLSLFNLSTCVGLKYGLFVFIKKLFPEKFSKLLNTLRINVNFCHFLKERYKKFPIE